MAVTVHRPGVAHPLRLTLERRPVHLPIVFERVIRFRGHRYEYRLAGVRARRPVTPFARSRNAPGGRTYRAWCSICVAMGGLLDEAVQVTRVFQGSGVVV